MFTFEHYSYAEEDNMENNETLKENQEFLRDFSLNKAKEFGKKNYGYDFYGFEFGNQSTRFLKSQISRIEDSSFEDNKKRLVEAIEQILSIYEIELEDSRKTIEQLRYSIEAIPNLKLSDTKLSEYILDSAVKDLELKEDSIQVTLYGISERKKKIENFSPQSVEEELEKLRAQLKLIEDNVQLKNMTRNWMSQIVKEMDSSITPNHL